MKETTALSMEAGGGMIKLIVEHALDEGVHIYK